MAEVLELKERRQLRAMLNPVRQDILHLLRRADRPMTASEVAERMFLSPTAAQGHLDKLLGLGLAERTAVSGSPATRYRAADVEVCLDPGRQDALQGEREALAAQLVDGVFRGLTQTEGGWEACRVFRFGALHLSPEEREELLEMVTEYLRTHGASRPGAEHWEYVLMAYREQEQP